MFFHGNSHNYANIETKLVSLFAAKSLKKKKKMFKKFDFKMKPKQTKIDFLTSLILAKMNKKIGNQKNYVFIIQTRCCLEVQ